MLLSKVVYTTCSHCTTACRSRASLAPCTPRNWRTLPWPKVWKYTKASNKHSWTACSVRQRRVPKFSTS